MLHRPVCRWPASFGRVAPHGALHCGALRQQMAVINPAGQRSGGMIPSVEVWSVGGRPTEVLHLPATGEPGSELRRNSNCKGSQRGQRAGARDGRTPRVLSSPAQPRFAQTFAHARRLLHACMQTTQPSRFWLCQETPGRQATTPPSWPACTACWAAALLCTLRRTWAWTPSGCAAAGSYSHLRSR